MDLEVFIPSIILNCIIVLISVYLIILFFKSKALHTYPCYNIIIYSLIILFDNVLRLIVLYDNVIMQYIQAFLLTSLDKLILATLSTQALIFYLGIIHTQNYYNHEKAIFFITLFLNIIICFTIGGIYIGVSGIRNPNKRLYYYCGNPDFKTPLDTIFNSIYLVISIYCCVVLMMYISKKKNDKETEENVKEIDFKRILIRILIIFFLNITTFVVSFMIIYDILHGLKTELIYLGICLLIDLFNNFNKTVLDETIKLFCRGNSEDKEKPQDLQLFNEKDKYDDNKTDDDDENVDKVRTESF